jgi:C-terminal processing protease CtpA/Prc
MPLDFEPAQYGIIDLSKQQDSDAATASSSSTPSSSTIAAITASNTDGSSPSSRGSRAGRVGYLKVLTFSATAPQAVAEALVDIQKEAQQPGGLAGLIVDLRDNPGGIVEAGVDIAQVCAVRSTLSAHLSWRC